MQFLKSYWKIVLFTTGVANVLITNPLWVVNSSLKMQGIARSNSREAAVCEKPERKYKGLIGMNLYNWTLYIFIYIYIANPLLNQISIFNFISKMVYYGWDITKGFLEFGLERFLHSCLLANLLSSLPFMNS